MSNPEFGITLCGEYAERLEETLARLRKESKLAEMIQLKRRGGCIELNPFDTLILHAILEAELPARGAISALVLYTMLRVFTEFEHICIRRRMRPKNQ